MIAFLFGLLQMAQAATPVAVEGRGAPTFVIPRIKVNPGVNMRLGFTNMSVDATVNPDFSQVESDAGQVTVNQWLSEHRAMIQRFASRYAVFV